MKHWARWPEGRSIQALAALLVILGLPACSTRAAYFDQYRQDLVLLKQICEQYNAGERIYRTIDGVEGVFQMKLRNPYPDWRDQFGLEEPWGAAFENDHPNFFRHELGGNRDQYWFYEQRAPWGSSIDAPYRRTILVKSNRQVPASQISQMSLYTDSEGNPLGSKQIRTKSLISKYGWTTEDLTTKKMREHWIAGSRLKVLVLATNEVLAERIDFYRAPGPVVQLSWSFGPSCGSESIGYDMTKFTAKHNYDFIRQVLRPTSLRPSNEQLKALEE